MDDVQWPPEFREEYEVLEVVGAGGMARVYRALYRKTGRTVAIKVLAPQAFSEEDSKKRFIREREVCSQLKHANIVPLLSYGDAGARPYLVFEFVEGPSLRDVLLRERKIDLVRALRYARHIAQGLSAAHAANIVHRDLKPDNVLIAESDDEARVADFGLARETNATPGKQKLTQTGIILGTPGYLSPELIRGEPATPAADLFALGVMLFEMLTGQLPLDAASEHELLIRYLREDLPPISSRGVIVPARVERIVAALLRRDVDRRANDALKLVEALKAAEVKGDEPDSPATRERPRSRGSALTRPGERTAISESNASLTPRVLSSSGARFIRKHPGISAAALAMLAALIVGAAGAFVFLARPVAAPVDAIAVAGTPQIIAGVTSASVRWQTSKDVETKLLVWEDGKPESSGNVIVPRGGALTGTRHELTVRGLQRNAHWLCAPLLGAARAPKTWPIELRTDLHALVADAAVRYVDLEHLEVSCEVKEEVTAGAVLQECADLKAAASPDETTPVWGPGRGPRKQSVPVPLPHSAAFQPWIAFRELEDSDNAAKNRIALPRIPGPDAMRRAVEALWAPPRPFEINAVTAEILRLTSKYYQLPKGGVPSATQVKALDEERRRQLLAEATRIAHARLAAHDVDLRLLASLVPLWRQDTRMSMPDRRHLHAALMRLSDLDGVTELVAGAPMVGFDRDLGIRQPASPNERVPEGGYRPLDHYEDKEVQEMLREHPLLLLSSANFGVSDSLVGIWNAGSGVLEAMQRLAITDPADPQHEKGLWIALPDLPADFPVNGPVRIVIQLTSMTPENRVWLRIGSDAVVCFRSTRADFRGFVATPLKATRAEANEKAQTMIADLPAGYLEPGARKLAVKLDSFPTHENGTPTPMAAWIVDLAIVPK